MPVLNLRLISIPLIAWSSAIPSQAPGSPKLTILTKNHPRNTLPAHIPMRVEYKGYFVSPAPRNPPARINWVDWKGWDVYKRQVKRVSELKSKRLGSISYAIEVVRGLFEFQPQDMQIVVDGDEKHVKRAWLCALTNSEKFGGGMKITPGAAFDDGFVHIGYLSETPRLRLIKLLFSVFKGQHVGKPGVHIGRGYKVTIDPPGYYPCHLDGDVRDVKYPLSVELVPGAIPFLVNRGNDCLLYTSRCV